MADRFRALVLAVIALAVAFPWWKLLPDWLSEDAE